MEEKKLNELKSILVEVRNAHYGGFRASIDEEEVKVVEWAIKEIDKKLNH
ncbi:hypothetical protein MZM54_02960 [[Brevibacterium] frigoritolerans]|nr:hypothetical protein [Peribacillus frigoritolerans]